MQSTATFKSESDRLLVIEALHLAASHWNATAHALTKKDWRQQATGGIAANFERRAIDALRLASEIEAAASASSVDPAAPGRFKNFWRQALTSRGSRRILFELSPQSARVLAA